MHTDSLPCITICRGSALLSDPGVGRPSDHTQSGMQITRFGATPVRLHNRTAAVVFYGAGSLVEERRAGDLQRSGTACPTGMVTGMASKKVTVTLDEAQLERIRALVEAGVAPSVSGFVQHAVGVSLDDVAGWGALLAEALQETGGALSDSERAWADEVLGVTQRGGRSAA
jgi:Arc/MetJ-type ribon-helix-helix transcriptional regulator